MKTVAVIGASTNRDKFGNKAVRAYQKAGYRVLPITPNHAEVEGLRAYASVSDVPDSIDIATLYVPAHIGETLMEEIARKQIPELWINPGAESEALIAKARSLGLAPIEACSIIGIGFRPAEF